MLSDFKKAAHVLMDAIELGLFKRVGVLDSGALYECRTGPIVNVDTFLGGLTPRTLSLKLKAQEDGRAPDIHQRCI